VKDADVMLFLGEAVTLAENSLHYPAGQRHAAIVFLRQESGSAPDWSRAVAELEGRGWFDVNLSEASPVSVETLDSVHPHAAASYEDALKNGFAVIIFSEPIDRQHSNHAMELTPDCRTIPFSDD
jgi:hypothetical protein